MDIQDFALEMSAGSGLPGIVTISASAGYRDIRFLGEFSTSILHIETKFLVGLTNGTDLYMVGVNSGSSGLVERSSQWEGVTFRYTKSHPIGSSDVFTWHYNFDIDVSKDDGIYGDGEWSIGPAAGIGFTINAL